MKDDKLIRLQVEEGEQEVVVPCKARRLNEKHIEWYKDGKLSFLTYSYEKFRLNLESD